MSADMLLPYFTEEDQLKYGISLLTNQKRKQEMVRAIETLTLQLNLTILTNLGPLILFLFDNADTDENAKSTLSVAIAVIKDLISTDSKQNIINVFGDEVTEDHVVSDLYKLFFVILTPWFALLRDELDRNIFSKFESSSSGTNFASNVAAKLLLYFDRQNIQRARKFLIDKYAKIATFNLRDLNRDIKLNISKVSQAYDNITMDMVKTLPQFIHQHKMLLKQHTAKEVMKIETENFSFDYYVYANSGNPLTLIQARTCTDCTEKDAFMTYFKIVAKNIFYMFSAKDVFVKQRGSTTNGKSHNLKYFINKPDCKCLSIDRLSWINSQVINYVEKQLAISPFELSNKHMQNTEALAYIMNNVVIANNQLKQTPEKRVFKITREMWLEYLSNIETEGTYGGAVNDNDYYNFKVVPTPTGMPATGLPPTDELPPYTPYVNDGMGLRPAPYSEQWVEKVSNWVGDENNSGTDSEVADDSTYLTVGGNE